MKLLDTHSHIYLEDFDNDRVEMLQRAEKEGIEKVFMPAIDSATHEKMLKVATQFEDRCLSMMGLHPCSVKENHIDELKIAEKHLQKNRFYGIGETGLDYYWDLTFKKEQAASFKQQIEWGLHFDLPIIIHSRNSLDDCIKMISDNQKGNLKGVFHCFSGTHEQANQIIDLGFYLGIGGVLTYKNSGLDKVMNALPLDNVILETDAPYLTPVPFRGKRNECSYLKFIVEKLSDVKQVSVDEVAEITTKNASELFSIEL
jgi:TatD DNase family protein